MRCTYWKSKKSLKLVNESVDFKIKFKQCKKSINCNACGELFPLTYDKIPIMWTDGLKNIFLEVNDKLEVNLEYENLFAKIKYVMIFQVNIKNSQVFLSKINFLLT